MSRILYNLAVAKSFPVNVQPPDSRQRAGQFFLRPITDLASHNWKATDRGFENRCLSTARRIASVVLSLLLLPFTILSVLIGMALLKNSKTHKDQCTLVRFFERAVLVKNKPEDFAPAISSVFKVVQLDQTMKSIPIQKVRDYIEGARNNPRLIAFVKDPNSQMAINALKNPKMLKEYSLSAEQLRYVRLVMMAISQMK